MINFSNQTFRRHFKMNFDGIHISRDLFGNSYYQRIHSLQIQNWIPNCFTLKWLLFARRELQSCFRGLQIEHDKASLSGKQVFDDKSDIANPPMNRRSRTSKNRLRSIPQQTPKEKLFIIIHKSSPTVAPSPGSNPRLNSTRCPKQGFSKNWKMRKSFSSSIWIRSTV